MERVLLQINKYPGINQRSISQKCNISLGKVNSLIEDIEYNGYIFKEIKGREHKYYITDKGIEYLESTISETKNTSLKLHVNEYNEIKTAVVLAAGKNNNFKEPVCLNEISEEPILIRTITQLTYLGMEKIIVVGGYQIDKLREILPQSVIVISNEDYKWTGTMASLAKTASLLNEDFLLVESDIVIETQGLKEMVECKQRDCILITVESGSGDEAFVELQDGKVHKISKDIRQLNKLDGEMIGISKISYPFFEKMMKLYKNNKNPYLNYEYLMLDVARDYQLGYLKIDNLLWHEVDSEEHLNYVIKKLMKRINKKEKMMHFENLKQIVCKCLNVSENEINDISPIGGMTNKNYKLIVNDNVYVLRVPGNGTEEMISRKEEIKNAQFANQIGVDAKLVYFSEETGVKISEFIYGAQTLSPEAAKKQESMQKVCAILKKLHSCGLDMANKFDIYEKIQQYEQLLVKVKGNNFADYESVRTQVFGLKVLLKELDIKLTACHNDTVAENFILGSEGELYLIDWEYGGMNDPMWDVAAFFLENGLDEIEQELFLKLYFEGQVKEEHKIRILINKIYQDFLWSIWTNIKEASGDDFGTYGIDRYNRAKENLEKLFIIVGGK